MCVFLWIMVCLHVCVCIQICMCDSQAIAIAVCEGRFRELHHSSTAFPDDFGGTTQQLLGFRECFSQLFLPLHKLWVTLKKKKKTTSKRFDLLYGH